MNAHINKQMRCATSPITIYPASYSYKKILFTILFSLYLALSLIGFLILSNRLINLIPLFLGLFALIVLSTRIRREYVTIYIFVGLLVISLLISSLIVGRSIGSIYIPIFFIVSSFGIAQILLRGFVYSWGGYIVFYGLAVYFLMLMLADVDLRSTIGSTNGVSIAILSACIPLYIILRREGKKIDLKPAIIALVISIWGLGRSGIISSIVLLVGLIFIKMRSKKVFLLSMIIIFIIAYKYQDAILDNLMNYPLIGKTIEANVQKWREGTANPRFTFWANYYENLDISRLLFGVNVIEDPWIEGAKNDFNYHNSFINLHIQTGVMGLITMVIILFSLFKYYRTNIVFFILAASYILRASTDLFIFFSRFDFILFFFIFHFLSRLSRSSASFSKSSIGRRLDINRLADYQQVKNDIH
jgi:hypothetical protein